MTPELLDACTGCSKDVAKDWASSITEAMRKYEINTNKRMAAFLGQITLESGGFKRLKENLNYDAKGLQATWPKRFDAVKALAYARQPERIANLVYADRMGNGDEDSGDGWLYRGRGLLQLTGRDAYHECGIALGLSLEAAPSLIAEPPYAAFSAGWEWTKGKLNLLADVWDLDGISDIINIGHKTFTSGDALGYKDRVELSNRALAALEQGG